ncbi:NADH:ubiquinone reductase (Na(+)-transporting) subunit F [Jannaschia seohaensis]|uniref:Na(+)-translocating NADH-quinone reductase subunit F n=1 Tax=Jannaschia seohaensis TaxID=475081 RepID=A0A2Y9AV06_9RHOB|nr:NADH:ubiquinone reductase (Na(+)-transporting) subunit F [Jannaschia seohaensis]PWJ16957.1 Na+-transporting NADH:ubiquinone oxidoreductase subunit F [Jannaschia seohaensis]SSA48204.1 Na+-transporting NADH:ubiquinone oxidoreductase subunit F [Jannaschia seohaensis]
MTEVLLGSATIVALVVGLALALVALRRALVPDMVLDVLVNGTRHLPAERGDSLLSVLHDGGVLIPAACGGSGTCGLCRVTVTGQGAGAPQATERGVLSPRERRAHIRLACQTRVRGDCAVTVSDDILTAGAGFLCKVASARMLAPLIREIVVDLPPEHASDFRAGDFMQITAPPYRLDFRDVDVPPDFSEAWEIAGWRAMTAESETQVTRAYSLASRPEDAGKAVFNIRLAVPPPGREEEVPPGLVSSWLFSLKAGDDITLSGPFGEFHIQDSGREMIFVGGGVGMAPLRAMIHQDLARGGQRRIRYFYGARSLADLFYTEEFEALAAKNDRFTWTPALSDPAPGDRWTGATGFVHETLRAELASHPAPDTCEFYLCGPPVMISAVLATLDRLGVEPSSIFYDDFGA